MARLLKDWKDANFWPTDMHSIECAEKIVKFYEDLIDRGTLRVVEEVEFKANAYDCSLTCTGCKEGFADYLMEEFEHVKFCPGCGQSIKRT